MIKQMWRSATCFHISVPFSIHPKLIKLHTQFRKFLGGDLPPGPHNREGTISSPSHRRLSRFWSASEMTYIVSGGALTTTRSITHSPHLWLSEMPSGNHEYAIKSCRPTNFIKRLISVTKFFKIPATKVRRQPMRNVIKYQQSACTHSLISVTPNWIELCVHLCLCVYLYLSVLSLRVSGAHGSVSGIHLRSHDIS